MTVLLIDNYDSFTWNLAHQVARLCGDMPQVVRNDIITISDIVAMAPRAVLISPGPGDPSQSGICIDLVGWLAEKRIPMFGVCLGMQILCSAYGTKIILAPRVAHGKVSPIQHFGDSLFDDVESPFDATRYHSLIVEAKSLNSDFAVTAKGPDDIIMAVRHKTLPFCGVQFHTESIASASGTLILGNFFRQETSVSVPNASRINQLTTRLFSTSDVAAHV